MFPCHVSSTEGTSSRMFLAGWSGVLPCPQVGHCGTTCLRGVGWLGYDWRGFQEAPNVEMIHCCRYKLPTSQVGKLDEPGKRRQEQGYLHWKIIEALNCLLTRISYIYVYVYTVIIYIYIIHDYVHIYIHTRLHKRYYILTYLHWLKFTQCMPHFVGHIPVIHHSIVRIRPERYWFAGKLVLFVPGHLCQQHTDTITMVNKNSLTSYSSPVVMVANIICILLW